jgi:hypothetical protein
LKHGRRAHRVVFSRKRPGAGTPELASVDVNAMNATTADDKTVTDALTRAQQRDIAQDAYHDAYYLGTCTAGATYWFSGYHDAIVRFDPDGGFLTFEFPGVGFLPEYIEHVDDRRGWKECRYVENTEEWLTEALA